MFLQPQLQQSRFLHAPQQRNSQFVPRFTQQPLVQHQQQRKLVQSQSLPQQQFLAQAHLQQQAFNTQHVQQSSQKAGSFNRFVQPVQHQQLRSLQSQHRMFI
jgi:hypothetical protein